MTDDPSLSRAGLPATIESVTADYSSSTLLLDEMLADLIASGENVTDACATMGVGVRQFYRRCGREPEFAKLMNEAQDAGSEVRASLTARIARGDPEAGSTGDWKRDQLIVKQENWLLSKRHPKRYGDKLQVESNNVTANVAISDDPVEAAKQYKEMMDRT